MEYLGHVENGVVILDDPAPLRNGAKVRVELLEEATPCLEGPTPLRYSSYTFDDPFTPAAPEGDWDAFK